MKGLMPLALSPSPTSPWNIAQTAREDEDMGDRAEDCLPELLARDLEDSAQIFSARKLTAGIPNSSISLEEKARNRGGKTALYSPYLAASARVQTLGAIEERESTVSFLGHHGPILADHTSESASTSSHSGSEEAEPPSFRHRGSIVTNATSVASTSWKPRDSPAPDDACDRSWIDGDFDADESDHRNRDSSLPASLYPRPPTPLGFSLNSSAANANASFSVPQLITIHRKSHSVSGSSPIVSPRVKPYNASMELPLRSASTSGERTPDSIEAWENNPSHTIGKLYQRRLTRRERPRSSRDSTRINALSNAMARNMTQQSDLVDEVPSRMSHDGFGPDEERVYDSRPRSIYKAEQVFIRPPTSPEPIRSVQSWLNSSLQPYPWTFQNEDATKVLPLPPDAVETLRVSVACFPETMLLTSSLTVETIRSYAKKMRQPTVDLASLMTEDAAPQLPRVSLWRKVVTYKRGQPSEAKAPSRRLTPRSGSTVASTSSSMESEGSKLWLPIQNVFSCCSDYICDAIYAHIVAYNYTSALVAKHPVPLHGHSRSNTANSVQELLQQDDIPKKAASLLGLAAGADMSIRPSHKSISPLADWTKDGMVTGRFNVPTAQDHALRIIQAGLLRCISRLVATARLMAENGSGEERMLDLEAEDADMLFIKSLCEIVRMAEESL
ncbi:hypothetical protein AAL_00398 [Moelleriella libera RCEF 2490]|uniref:Uncharacterized protein n=1 Tax=Moelleriella libera RCEF 2490 TaxID=1081109 RepID=A0A166UTA4_9HYPO|nr:hypothetical protein AAL_00398 [Moelleriella libera RCEF 2490]